MGLTASCLAAITMLHAPSMRAFPDVVIGFWAPLASGEILAGTDANSGLDANVVRASTAAMRGLAASAHC